MNLVEGKTAKSGSKSNFQKCKIDTNQVWKIEGETIKHSASNRCLDIPNEITDKGTQLQIYICNGTNAQKFRTTPIGG